ncbi:MAG TPA: hypothetical protein V6C58_11225, partial [Allocoleopsis sp.]
MIDKNLVFIDSSISHPETLQMGIVEDVAAIALDANQLFSWQSYLQNFANSPNFFFSLRSIFGENFTTEQASYLQQQWLSGNYQFLFNGIEIRSSAELAGANGAYSITTGKIYLASEFIAQNSPEKVIAVLLEEYGHVVDNYLNIKDTMGDEGQLFSAVVRGENLSVSELNTIKQENDHAIANIDGEKIAIEMSSSTTGIIQFGSSNYDNAYGIT